MFDKMKQLQYGLKILSDSKEHTRLVELGGHKVQIMEGGEGEPLLYLHSALGENLWLPFHTKLAEKFRVIAPAHPGFAQSEGLEDIDNMEDIVFHYLDLMDHLGLNSVNIAGVSLGGWIAVELATRYPDRVKKLVIAAAAGLWLDDHPMTDLFALLRYPARLRPVLFHDPKSFLAGLIISDNPIEQQMIESYKAMAATAKLAWNPPGHNPKLAGRLHRVKSPTLIVWGDDDKLIPAEYAEAYQKGIKDSRVEILKDCGHLLMFECEDAFVKAVSGFLS
ncbi:MAG TPA: alpha/beta hydrolase [Blastocatellia bacterium]|nr:alpha/beta hydrolase [Blastocatellia bacterium]